MTLHRVRVVRDHRLYHRSVVRIAVPYTGPGFVWLARAASWTWDLQFDFTLFPPNPTPDSAFAWGIHGVHPHPPERIANWLPRVGVLFDPAPSLPTADRADHGQHVDHLEIRVAAAGVDAAGNPMHDITMTFVHAAAGVEPEFDDPPPRSWWEWLWELLRWLRGASPTILAGGEPPFRSPREDLERAVRRDDPAP